MRREGVIRILLGGMLVVNQLVACPFDYFIADQLVVMASRDSDPTDPRYFFPSIESRSEPLRNALGSSPQSKKFHIGAVLSVVHGRNLGIGPGLHDYQAILAHLLGIPAEKIRTPHVSDSKGILRNWVLEQFEYLHEVRPPVEFTDESFDRWIKMIVANLKTEYVEVIPLKRAEAR